MAPDDPRYGPPDLRYDRRYRTRRATDPFVAGVSDGVAQGYQAIENVVWGLQESLRLQARPRLARRPPTQRAPRGAIAPGARIAPGISPASERGRIASGPPRHPQRQGRIPGPGTVGYPGGGISGGDYRPYYDRPLGLGLLDDVSAVLADLLNRAAEAAHDVADAIIQQTEHGGGAGDECITELALSASPGQTANVRFHLWNTGAGALRSVRFDATDLLGAAERIAMNAVSFTPALVDFVRSRDAAPVVISIAVPDGVVPGVYRGLVQAEPGNDCVVLELTVVDPGPVVGPGPAKTSPADDQPPSEEPLKQASPTPPPPPTPPQPPTPPTPPAPPPPPSEPESGPAPEHEQ